MHFPEKKKTRSDSLNDRVLWMHYGYTKYISYFLERVEGHIQKHFVCQELLLQYTIWLFLIFFFLLIHLKGAGRGRESDFPFVIHLPRDTTGWKQEFEIPSWSPMWQAGAQMHRPFSIWLSDVLPWNWKGTKTIRTQLVFIWNCMWWLSPLCHNANSNNNILN